MFKTKQNKKSLRQLYLCSLPSRHICTCQILQCMQKKECIWKCASCKNKEELKLSQIRKRTYVSVEFLLRSRWCMLRLRVYCVLPAGRCKWWKALGLSAGMLLLAQSWCASVGEKLWVVSLCWQKTIEGIFGCPNWNMLFVKCDDFVDTGIVGYLQFMTVDICSDKMNWKWLWTGHNYLFLVIPLPVHQFISCDLIFLAGLHWGYPWK